MPKNKGGRPPIAINWEEFDKLCALQCTEVEIAGWFHCSVDTVARALKRKWKMSFAEYFEEKAARGRISIRRHQFEIAQRGNVPMLIWLGKQWLSQRDKIESEHEHKGEIALKGAIEYIAIDDVDDSGKVIGQIRLKSAQGN